MQKTSHLHLNTWVESDPVSVAEISENFAILDDDAAAKTAIGQKHKAALSVLALHTAERALEAYHADTLSGAKDNLILADFSKSDDWSAVSGITIGETAISGGSSYTGYSKDIPVVRLSSSQWTEIDRFVALGDGKLTGMAIRCTAYDANGAAHFRIRCGNEEIASASNVWAAPLQQPCSIALDNQNIELGKTYVIEGKSANESDPVDVSGTMTVTVTPTSSQSGYVVTKEFDVAGSALYVFVNGTGAAPTVSMLNHSGTTQAMTAAGLKEAVDVFGNTVTRYAFKAENFSWNKVRIKVQLSGTASVGTVCGIVI